MYHFISFTPGEVCVCTAQQYSKCLFVDKILTCAMFLVELKFASSCSRIHSLFYLHVIKLYRERNTKDSIKSGCTLCVFVRRHWEQVFRSCGKQE